jgi:glycosyltransferase involved in cell wall biosynthesis
MASAKALILPSECYETFGRVAVEAYARGTPVVAARIGAVAEIVRHGSTGMCFTPGDAPSLAGAMEWVNRNPEEVAGMRLEARREFESKYTAEQNYRLMLGVYERAKAVQKEHAS